MPIQTIQELLTIRNALEQATGNNQHAIGQNTVEIMQSLIDMDELSLTVEQAQFINGYTAKMNETLAGNDLQVRSRALEKFKDELKRQVHELSIEQDQKTTLNTIVATIEINSIFKFSESNKTKASKVVTSQAALDTEEDDGDDYDVDDDDSLDGYRTEEEDEATEKTDAPLDRLNTNLTDEEIQELSAELDELVAKAAATAPKQPKISGRQNNCLLNCALPTICNVVKTLADAESTKTIDANYQGGKYNGYIELKNQFCKFYDIDPTTYTFQNFNNFLKSFLNQQNDYSGSEAQKKHIDLQMIMGCVFRNFMAAKNAPEEKFGLVTNSIDKRYPVLEYDDAMEYFYIPLGIPLMQKPANGEINEQTTTMNWSSGQITETGSTGVGVPRDFLSYAPSEKAKVASEVIVYFKDGHFELSEENHAQGIIESAYQAGWNSGLKDFKSSISLIIKPQLSKPKSLKDVLEALALVEVTDENQASFNEINQARYFSKILNTLASLNDIKVKQVAEEYMRSLKFNKRASIELIQFEEEKKRVKQLVQEKLCYYQINKLDVREIRNLSNGEYNSDTLKQLPLSFPYIDITKVALRIIQDKIDKNQKYKEILSAYGIKKLNTSRVLSIFSLGQNGKAEPVTKTDMAVYRYLKEKKNVDMNTLPKEVQDVLNTEDADASFKESTTEPENLSRRNGKRKEKVNIGQQQKNTQVMSTLELHEKIKKLCKLLVSSELKEVDKITLVNYKKSPIKNISTFLGNLEHYMTSQEVVLVASEIRKNIKNNPRAMVAQYFNEMKFINDYLKLIDKSYVEIIDYLKGPSNSKDLGVSTFGSIKYIALQVMIDKLNKEKYPSSSKESVNEVNTLLMAYEHILNDTKSEIEPHDTNFLKAVEQRVCNLQPEMLFAFKINNYLKAKKLTFEKISALHSRKIEDLQKAFPEFESDIFKVLMNKYPSGLLILPANLIEIQQTQAAQILEIALLEYEYNDFKKIQAFCKAKATYSEIKPFFEENFKDNEKLKLLFDIAQNEKVGARVQEHVIKNNLETKVSGFIKSAKTVSELHDVYQTFFKDIKNLKEGLSDPGKLVTPNYSSQLIFNVLNNSKSLPKSKVFSSDVENFYLTIKQHVESDLYSIKNSLWNLYISGKERSDGDVIEKLELLKQKIENSLEGGQVTAGSELERVVRDIDLQIKFYQQKLGITPATDNLELYFQRHDFTVRVLNESEILQIAKIKPLGLFDDDVWLVIGGTQADGSPGKNNVHHDIQLCANTIWLKHLMDRASHKPDILKGILDEADPDKFITKLANAMSRSGMDIDGGYRVLVNHIFASKNDKNNQTIMKMMKEDILQGIRKMVNHNQFNSISNTVLKNILDRYDYSGDIEMLPVNLSQTPDVSSSKPSLFDDNNWETISNRTEVTNDSEEIIGNFDLNNLIDDSSSLDDILSIRKRYFDKDLNVKTEYSFRLLSTDESLSIHRVSSNRSYDDEFFESSTVIMRHDNPLTSDLDSDIASLGSTEDSEFEDDAKLQLDSASDESSKLMDEELTQKLIHKMLSFPVPTIITGMRIFGNNKEDITEPDYRNAVKMIDKEIESIISQTKEAVTSGTKDELDDALASIHSKWLSIKLDLNIDFGLSIDDAMKTGAVKSNSYLFSVLKTLRNQEKELNDKIVALYKNDNGLISNDIDLALLHLYNRQAYMEWLEVTQVAEPAPELNALPVQLNALKEDAPDPENDLITLDNLFRSVFTQDQLAVIIAVGDVNPSSVKDAFSEDPYVLRIVENAKAAGVTEASTIFGGAVKAAADKQIAAINTEINAKLRQTEGDEDPVVLTEEQVIAIKTAKTLAELKQAFMLDDESTDESAVISSYPLQSPVLQELEKLPDNLPVDANFFGKHVHELAETSASFLVEEYISKHATIAQLKVIAKAKTVSDLAKGGINPQLLACLPDKRMLDNLMFAPLSSDLLDQIEPDEPDESDESVIASFSNSSAELVNYRLRDKEKILAAISKDSQNGRSGSPTSVIELDELSNRTSEMSEDEETRDLFKRINPRDYRDDELIQIQHYLKENYKPDSLHSVGMSQTFSKIEREIEDRQSFSDAEEQVISKFAQEVFGKDTKLNRKQLLDFHDATFSYGQDLTLRSDLGSCNFQTLKGAVEKLCNHAPGNPFDFPKTEDKNAAIKRLLARNIARDYLGDVKFADEIRDAKGLSEELDKLTNKDAVLDDIIAKAQEQVSPTTNIKALENAIRLKSAVAVCEEKIGSQAEYVSLAPMQAVEALLQDENLSLQQLVTVREVFEERKVFKGEYKYMLYSLVLQRDKPMPFKTKVAAALPATLTGVLLGYQPNSYKESTKEARALYSEAEEYRRLYDQNFIKDILEDKKVDDALLKQVLSRQLGIFDETLTYENRIKLIKAMYKKDKAGNAVINSDVKLDLTKFGLKESAVLSNAQKHQFIAGALNQSAGYSKEDSTVALRQVTAMIARGKVARKSLAEFKGWIPGRSKLNAEQLQLAITSFEGKSAAAIKKHFSQDQIQDIKDAADDYQAAQAQLENYKQLIEILKNSYPKSGSEATRQLNIILVEHDRLEELLTSQRQQFKALAGLASIFRKQIDLLSLPKCEGLVFIKVNEEFVYKEKNNGEGALGEMVDKYFNAQSAGGKDARGCFVIEGTIAADKTSPASPSVLTVSGGSPTPSVSDDINITMTLSHDNKRLETTLKKDASGKLPTLSDDQLKARVLAEVKLYISQNGIPTASKPIYIHSADPAIGGDRLNAFRHLAILKLCGGIQGFEQSAIRNEDKAAKAILQDLVKVFDTAKPSIDPDDCYKIAEVDLSGSKDPDVKVLKDQANAPTSAKSIGKSFANAFFDKKSAFHKKRAEYEEKAQQAENEVNVTPRK